MFGVAGTDASKQFNMLHNKKVLTKYGAPFMIGRVGGGAPAGAGAGAGAAAAAAAAGAAAGAPAGAAAGVAPGAAGAGAATFMSVGEQLSGPPVDVAEKVAGVQGEYPTPVPGDKGFTAPGVVRGVIDTVASMGLNAANVGVKAAYYLGMAPVQVGRRRGKAGRRREKEEEEE